MSSTSARIAPASGPPCSTHKAVGKTNTLSGPSITSTTTASSAGQILVDDHASSNGSALLEVVAFSPWRRRLLWLLVLLIVGGNVALLTESAILYQQYDVPNTRLWFFRVNFLTNDANLFVERSAYYITAGYACLAAVYGVCVVYLLYVSIRSRGLFFGMMPSASTRPVRSPRPSTTTSSRWWRSFQRRITTVRYLVSIQGPYFETRLLLDDSIEMVSQTAAAVAASHSISNVGLNLTYGIVIFLTSIVPTFSKRVFRYSLGKQRLACLVADLILEFVWGSVLPIWMAYPVRQIYNNHALNAQHLHTIANPTREIERVLVLSWPSYLLSVIPFVSTLLNLIELQSILQDLRLPLTVDSQHTAINTAVLTLSYAAQSSRKRQHIMLRGFHKLVPLYGLMVLITSILASRVLHPATSASAFECINRVNPWFATVEACVGRRINCSSAGIQGYSHEIEIALSGFHAQTLRDLFFTDCKQLTIPKGIRRFTGLHSIAVSDSCVIQWAQDAALVNPHLPDLCTVKFTNVVFAEIPTGLVAQPLSSSVDWMYFVNVPNATLLLDTVGDRWQHLNFFHCELCALTTFPAALKTMRRIAVLELTFNDIREIPEDWNVDPANVQLNALRLDANTRLEILPDSLWRQAARSELISLEYTGLTAIPDWLVDTVTDAGFRISAGGTPLCAQPDTIPLRIRPLLICTAA